MKGYTFKINKKEKVRTKKFETEKSLALKNVENEKIAICNFFSFQFECCVFNEP